MKKLILSVISFLLLVSCATAPLDILENDDQLRMIGGKESLLDAIQYPEFALNKGIEGVVTVLAYVDTSGMVRDCKVLEGNEYLNPAAVSAMKKQRFHPYVLEGEKRPVRVAIPISFTISKDVDIRSIDQKMIKDSIRSYINAPILTISSSISSRSPGGVNDYYSEAETWWPSAHDPKAPYVIREGEVNPEAFIKHKERLKRFAEITSGLTGAYLVTGKKDYAMRALEHIKAWFIDPQTRMQPHFKYAQAIPYRNSERLVGIMDALPLADILRSMHYLKDLMENEDRAAIVKWLKDYEHYLEFDHIMQSVMSREDNYSLVWLLQMASVTAYLEDSELMKNCRYYFTEHTLKFMTALGSPYMNESLNRMYTFNIFIAADMLAVITELLSDHDFNAWQDAIIGIQRPGDLVNYLYSGLLNYDLKLAGYYKGRFISLLLAGKAYDNSRYLDLWRDIDAGNPGDADFPFRQAVLWVK